jgi:hypothetical protein
MAAMAVRAARPVEPVGGAAMRGADAPTQEDRKPATKTDNGWEDLDSAVVDYGRQFSVGTGRKDGYLAEPWLDYGEALTTAPRPQYRRD